MTVDIRRPGPGSCSRDRVSVGLIVTTLSHPLEVTM